MLKRIDAMWATGVKKEYIARVMGVAKRTLYDAALRRGAYRGCP
jgi:hypothetical protein